MTSALGGVGRAVLLGAVFVVLVLFVPARATCARRCSSRSRIPLSIALAGLLLQPLGVGLNTMTLGGLAIAVGLLVDAAIIMVENIVHRLRAARRRGASARAARSRPRSRSAGPIAFATLIVIVGVPAAVRR